MKLYRLIIIDDELVIRESLINWFSIEYETYSFESSESFLDSYNKLFFDESKPTCILLDFKMQGMNGIELQNILNKMNVKFPIVFMSGNAQNIDIINAWRGGSVDFILKPFRADQVSAILKKQFDILIDQKIKYELLIGPQSQDVFPITRREAQVLLLLGKGHTQIEVAKKLCISLRTVKMYRAFIKNKLGLESLFEIVSYCEQYGSSISAIAKSNDLKH